MSKREVMVLEETYRKLSGQEIVELNRQGKLWEVAFKGFEKAFDIGLAFIFGVDKIQIGAYTRWDWWGEVLHMGPLVRFLAAIWRACKRETAKRTSKLDHVAVPPEDLYPTGYRLTINGSIIGVYLCPSVEEFRRHYATSPSIVPSVELAGTVDHRDFADFTFYVLPAEYDQFCRDAYEIFTEYCREGRCFRMIPDFWFSDMALVQFIRDKMRPHPAMRSWFNPPPSLAFEGLGHTWYSPKFNR